MFGASRCGVQLWAGVDDFCDCVPPPSISWYMVLPKPGRRAGEVYMDRRPRREPTPVSGLWPEVVVAPLGVLEGPRPSSDSRGVASPQSPDSERVRHRGRM